MKLTLETLTQLLETNEALTKQALKANNLKELVNLSNHRAILKDCIIELLTDKLNTITYRNEVLNAIIDSKCENEEIVSKWY